MPPNPWPAVPEGECVSENQDGISTSQPDGSSRHNLYDSPNFEQPMIQSGDWQQRPPTRKLRNWST
jgi:hypothetical protein